MHVDDFMIVAVSEPVLDRVTADMNNVFGEVSAVRWRKHDYTVANTQVDTKGTLVLSL